MVAFVLQASQNRTPWIDVLRGAACRIVHGAARIIFSASVHESAEESGSIPTRELILRFQQGQPRTFELLYDRYKDYVYRVAFFTLRHGEEAEDAVQETFMDLLKALPRYNVDGPARFETWLYRVTVNRCRMGLRRKRAPSAEWDDVEERLERLPLPGVEQPEALTLERERAGALWHAVESLPDEHRLTILLRYKEGLSYTEIAETLGINEGTVKSRLYNAHRKLKQALDS